VEVVYFETPAELRAWFEAHHETATELWVGFHKKATGRPSLTWSEAVDQALCFGWIDGIRKSVDEGSYTNRFTPRKSTSNWSNVNIAKVEQLTAAGLMTPAGARAFAARDAARSGVYSFEQAQAGFPAEVERQFREHEAAWTFYQAQPAGYRRLTCHWVMSAKREETRQKRLGILIEDSANGRRIAQLARPTKTNG
jgi:uncharacterized protein YdeI (YjbR/CyaY-like superfamily)